MLLGAAARTPLNLLVLLVLGAAATPPNLIVLLADDLGWGDVHYNDDYLQPGAGGTHWQVDPPRTPNLDALARGPNTLRLDRFYAGNAVCSPTRAAILTGRAPSRI